MKKLGLIGLLIVSLFAPGCTSSGTKAPQKLTGDPVADGKIASREGRAQDRLLWAYRGAATSLRRGNYAEARQLLDESITQLNGMFGKDRDASKSRSAFYRESKKTFYGEPYERVMAYYYRGIL